MNVYIVREDKDIIVTYEKLKDAQAYVKKNKKRSIIRHGILSIVECEFIENVSR